MSTGNIETLGGQLSEIGPLYPFVGTEFVLVILAYVFWIAWHAWQFHLEKKEYQEELERYVTKDVLGRVLKREKEDSGI